MSLPPVSDAKLSTQNVGNMGMFYACLCLSRLGWNAMPTSRNARGIDIVAYSPDGGQFLGLQVKSLSKQTAVPLGSTLDNIMGDQWIIVTKVKSEEPSVFIISPNEVKERAHRGEKDGRISYWLWPSKYDQPKFRDAWNRLQPKKTRRLRRAIAE